MNELLRKIRKRIKRCHIIGIPAVFFYRVLTGYWAYRRIIKTFPPDKDVKIFFMDYGGSGDTYLSCAYLAARQEITEKSFFVAAGSLSLKIARLFDFKGYLEVSPDRAFSVRIMERFCGVPLRLQPLLYESDPLGYSGILRLMAGHRGLDFMSMLKIGLEVNCGIPYEEKPWRQPEFPYDPVEVDKIFRTHGLAPGKIVLLAPYAGKQNMWGIPMEFYTKLAAQLRAAGYTVCTNSGDPQKEPPVPGTLPLLVPHHLMRPFCERAGYFIGLRSGLCDIISAVKLRAKIVLYPVVRTEGIAFFREFFSLKNMGLCEDAVELELRNFYVEKIISKILDFFNEEDLCVSR